MSDATATNPDGSEVVDALVSEDAAPEPRRSRGQRRPPLWVRATVALLVLAVIGLLAFLSQTGTGQRLVINEILERVRGELAGTLSVGSIRSPTLFAGLTLADVRLEAEGGDRVLVADSVVVRYSLISLLAGSPRVSSTTLHGLDLEISRGPGDEELNVERILPDGDGSGGTGAPTPLELGRISVRGGSIFVLMPADEPSRTTIVAPDGSHLRRLSFEGVDLDLEETVLRSGGAVAFDARLTSFSGTVRVVEEPFVVRAAVGSLTFGDDGLRIADGTFRLPGSLLEGSLGFGPEGPGEPWRFTAAVSADDWSDLADLAWIDPRVPAGEFRGAVTMGTGSGLALSLREVQVRTADSDVRLSGAVRFDGEMTLSRMAVSAGTLDLSEVEPWAARDIPLEGTLSGEATLSGTLDALSADGRLTFTPGDGEAASSTAAFAGRLFVGDDPGADSLVVRLDPFDYDVLAA